MRKDYHSGSWSGSGNLILTLAGLRILDLTHCSFEPLSHVRCSLIRCSKLSQMLHSRSLCKPKPTITVRRWLFFPDLHLDRFSTYIFVLSIPFATSNELLACPLTLSPRYCACALQLLSKESLTELQSLFFGRVSFLSCS